MKKESTRGAAIRLGGTLLLASALLAPPLLTGCAASHTRAVTPQEIRRTLDATAPDLEASYNAQAQAVRSVNATVRINTVAGSAYSGVIREYHDVGGFLVMAKPSLIRIIGQAPVVATNIFDMVSDGRIFHIFIPSKNQFLVGSTTLDRASKNPIENLRPQHVIDAFFWPELPSGSPVLFEQFDALPDHYYVLTVLRNAPAGNLEIDRKVWFDRRNLRVSRLQIYGPAGRLDSDIAYDNWQPPDSAPTPASPAATTQGAAVDPVVFPRQISIRRPQQDYQLTISIQKLTLNADTPPERFQLNQPPGSQLVRVDQDQQPDQNRPDQNREGAQP